MAHVLYGGTNTSGEGAYAIRLIIIKGQLRGKGNDPRTVADARSEDV